MIASTFEQKIFKNAVYESTPTMVEFIATNTQALAC